MARLGSLDLKHYILHTSIKLERDCTIWTSRTGKHVLDSSPYPSGNPPWKSLSSKSSYRPHASPQRTFSQIPCNIANTRRTSSKWISQQPTENSGVHRQWVIASANSWPKASKGFLFSILMAKMPEPEMNPVKGGPLSLHKWTRWSFCLFAASRRLKSQVFSIFKK